MRHIYRFITLCLLTIASNAHAIGVFMDVLDWRPTETNDWAYVNSLTVPTQTLGYKTIDFSYAPALRVGMTFNSYLDTVLSYTHLFASTSDSAVGHIQPAFLGSVNAKPSSSYLYSSGQVRQTIDFNIFDVNVGKPFTPTSGVLLHPMVGLMGGWINQSIFATYRGSTTSNESIKNNFTGIGPKVGIDTSIRFINVKEAESSVLFGFAASYLYGDWDINDVTKRTPTLTIINSGANHRMGAITLQALVGLKVDYKQLSAKLAYEFSDWFDQTQIFDNDTGAHNNDLILQGLTLGVSYRFDQI